MERPVERTVGLRRLGPLVLVALVVGGFWAYQRFELGSPLTVAGMRARVQAYGVFGPIVFMAMLWGGIFLRVPAVWLVAIGGLLFEGPRAFAYSWLAAVSGATSTFLLVRWFGREAFRRALFDRFARLRALDERLERHGFVTVLGLRLVLFMASPLNWAMGATRVRVSHYIAGTALGVSPAIAAIVVFADAIVGGGSGDTMLSLGAMAAGAAIVLMIVLGAIAGRRLFGTSSG